jgi:hypothetical protein
MVCANFFVAADGKQGKIMAGGLKSVATTQKVWQNGNIMKFLCNSLLFIELKVQYFLPQTINF